MAIFALSKENKVSSTIKRQKKMKSREINFIIEKTNKIYVPNDWNKTFFMLRMINGAQTFIECRFDELFLGTKPNSSCLNMFSYRIETPIGMYRIPESLIYNHIFIEPKKLSFGDNMRTLLKYGKYIKLSSILSDGEIHIDPYHFKAHYQHKFYVWNGIKAITEFRRTECGYLSYRNGVLNEHIVPLKDGEYLTKEECEEKNSINVILFGKNSETESKKTYSVTLGENSSIEVDEDTYNLVKSLIGSKEE